MQHPKWFLNTAEPRLWAVTDLMAHSVAAAQCSCLGTSGETGGTQCDTYVAC